jgi:hypothetical protein
MTPVKGSCIAAVGSFVLLLGVSVAVAAPLAKISLCHKGVDIVVSENSLAAHLAHGDALGTCGTVCACQPSIDPVACSDGNTYINQCVADCAGATGCGRVCPCQPSIDPVICSNRNTYVNQCVADCDGATGCVPPCSSCPADVNTVLCTTGNFYDNQCKGICAGEEKCYYVDNAVICDPNVSFPPGSCPGFSPLICPNGASYANQCVADACLHGQTAGCTGACLFTAPSCTQHNPVTCSNGTTYTNPCFATCDGATGCVP